MLILVILFFEKLPETLLQIIIESTDWETITSCKRVSQAWNKVLIQDVSLVNQIPAMIDGYQKKATFLQTKINSVVFELQGTKQKFQLAVVTLTGKVLLINCCYDWTVEDLKDAIMDKDGIPSDQQRLICGGKQLEDSRTLVDYNLPSHHTIVDLVLRLRGD